MKLEAVLNNVSCQLKEVGIENSRHEARLILSHILGLSKEKIFLEKSLKVSKKDLEDVSRVTEMRCARKPLSKIKNVKEFWSLDFFVNEDVLDPRPDSEILIEAVTGRINDKNQNISVLELGVGSGCLVVTLLHLFENAKAVATDISLNACQVARKNAKMHGVSDRLEVCQMSWGSSLDGKFDVIISNPPYISLNDKNALQPEVHYDPSIALYGGDDGLDCYRSLAPDIRRLLSCDGFAVLEIGDDQEKDVEGIFAQEGLKVLEIKKDLSLKNRCLIVQLKE